MAAIKFRRCYRNLMKSTFFTLLILVLSVLLNGCNTKSSQGELVLHRIEAYQPPPYPDTYKDIDIDGDVYDYGGARIFL